MGTAYLFTALVTWSQMSPSPGIIGGMSLRIWDTCTSAIVCGADAERARKTFEKWCHKQGDGESPASGEIRKIVQTRLVDGLITESGVLNFDCCQISRQFIESTREDE